MSLFEEVNLIPSFGFHNFSNERKEALACKWEGNNEIVLQGVFLNNQTKESLLNLIYFTQISNI